MQDASVEQRRYPRFPAAIPATLKLREGTLKLITGNVSRHGAFLRTDNPRPERELIQIRFSDPGPDITAMCMVVRAFPPAAPSPMGPGMGVDFFAISREAKDSWDAWVQDVKTRGFGPGVHPDGRPLEDAPEEEIIIGDELADELIVLDTADEVRSAGDSSPTKREHPRQRAMFLVRMNDRAQLRDFLTIDISQGGMFLRTPLLQPRGEKVDLVVVHPETGEEFHISGKVVRVMEDDDEAKKGLGIRFAKLTGDRLQALTEFIETGTDALQARKSPEDKRFVDLKKAVERAPNSASAQSAMGIYLLETGDLTGAVNALTKAMMLAPDSVGVHESLARAYRNLKDTDRAEAHGRVAAALTIHSR
jgi:Tfp pilus assembly protein PilZ